MKKAFKLNNTIRTILVCTLIGLSFWVCSKNPPLAPDAQNLGGQVKILAGVQSNPNVIAPGGSSIIQALILDPANQPVVGEDVQFSASFGTLVPSTATTSDSGIATSIFTAPLQSSGTATITGIYNSTQTQSVDIEVRDSNPQSITLTPDDFTLLANGISSTKIKSIWRNDIGQPLRGIRVTFQTTNGSIVTTEITDVAGVATTTLTSTASRVDLIAQVTALANGLQAMTQVLFKGIEVSLNATPRTLTADGRSTSRITTVLKEATTKIAVSDADVTFGSNLGTIPNIATTNASGVATVDLTSSTQTGVSTVTVRYGQTLIDTLQISISQSVPTFLNVSASPTMILADNQSISSIKAVVSDQSNNPVPDGTPVEFSIVSGTGTIESNKVMQSGVATSRLTSSTQPDTVTIAVQVAGLTDTTTVYYVVGPPANITLTADSRRMQIIDVVRRPQQKIHPDAH